MKLWTARDVIIVATCFMSPAPNAKCATAYSAVSTAVLMDGARNIQILAGTPRSTTDEMTCANESGDSVLAIFPVSRWHPQVFPVLHSFSKGGIETRFSF
jgi:hypothetical protein